MNVLVLHGPNLNLTGERDPRHYGDSSLAAIDARLPEVGESRGVAVTARQTNHEGQLIDWIQEAAFGDTPFHAVVLNPGGYAHTSVALRDAVAAAVERGVPVIEVHLSNVHGREAFRTRLLTAGVASGLVAGLGPLSYELGLEAAVALAPNRSQGA